MPDFARLIDAEIWKFIRETGRWYPPDTVEKTVQEQRDIYDAMCRKFFAGYPQGVSANDHNAHGVPVRHYPNPGQDGGPLVLYFHGGGYVVGGLDSHDDICAEICAECGFDVVSVDYRLCPEHPHPAAFDDAMTACAWARKRFDEPLILVGDSAGGNLAAAVAHAVRGQAEILGQVLSYPGLGGDPDNGSYRVMADAPMLTLADVLGYSGLRSGGVRHDGDASFAPLWDSDFSAAQPTVSISAKCDPLCDDARDYALAINAAGGVAVWINDKGLVHGHLRARHTVTRARASFDRVLRAIRLIGSGDAVTRAKIKG